MKFNEDVVGVNREHIKIDDLKSKYKELIKSFLQIQTEVEKSDKEISLYLMNKSVKE